MFGGARETGIARASGSESAIRRMARLVARDEQIRSSEGVARDACGSACESTESGARIATACDVFADRPCLGVASSGGGHDVLDVDLSRALAAGNRRSDPSPPEWTTTWRAAPCVGIYADTGVDWVVADLACLYLGAVSVPMQRGAALDDLVHVARETELACIFADGRRSPRSRILRSGVPAFATSLSWAEPGIRDSPAVRVHDLDQIVAAGVQGAVNTDAAAAADELFSVVYTSGTPVGRKA